MVSLVLPIYNEQPNLAPLFEEIAIALEDLPHEIVAVDDGSTDGSLSELHRLRGQYPSVRVLALEGRSGQSAATVAGFAAVRGDVVITIDADGQNDPADIPTLLEALAREPSLAAAVPGR